MKEPNHEKKSITILETVSRNEGRNISVQWFANHLPYIRRRDSY